MSDAPKMSAGDPLGGGGPPKAFSSAPPAPPAPPAPRGHRNRWQKLPGWAQWTIGIFAGLMVISALAGDPEKEKESERASAATTTASGTAGTAPTEPVEESTPEPTPDPEVEVSYSGPDSARTDNVTLRGTVDPANARVRVRGRSVKVRDGRWSVPVRLSKRGENTFSVVGSRKGHTKFTDTITVTRKLSAAERAEIRRKRALARANARAVEKAESYLLHTAFSKKGLYEQLLYEKFTESEASYAVEHIRVNWKKQAVEKAKSYLSHSSFSRDGLVEQLIYEGFTPEQASYGADRAY